MRWSRNRNDNADAPRSDVVHMGASLGATYVRRNNNTYNNQSINLSYLKMQRHIRHYGEVPRELVADGSYGSAANVIDAKSLGVTHVAFHKPVGLTVEAMTGDRWLYNKLRRFRAGIEAMISYLKRCFGLSRCNWKGLDHFKAYVHSAMFTHNLVVLTRRLAPD